ncbi:hypothetical protein BWI93_14675 [Siphonobacter sp. BAB-5385]|uniref:DUF433 domain-containing protein n=1 Tax=unclassified Siphonobacter TaxID=2635712 RepID=UPI000B9E19D4|nr:MULTISPECIES: DUF433 domain-containing protein [unclassified Siphonobacter]OZI07436.1 hypothetical protein BWI93_14675 [Siphonobacter sp. BAB-5385]PMD96981.1 hypothetical protein BWI97_09885 [Siphonobacter sp. BAB-5405]
MNWQERIESDEQVLLGKPVIKGTRLSVEFLIGRLADGWSEQTILENYPQLSREDLQAVFGYIQDCLRDGLLFHQSIPSKAA